MGLANKLLTLSSNMADKASGKSFIGIPRRYKVGIILFGVGGRRRYLGNIDPQNPASENFFQSFRSSTCGFLMRRQPDPAKISHPGIQLLRTTHCEPINFLLAHQRGGFSHRLKVSDLPRLRDYPRVEDFKSERQ